MLPNLSQLHPASIDVLVAKRAGIQKHPRGTRSQRVRGAEQAVAKSLASKHAVRSANQTLEASGLGELCLIHNNEHNAGGFKTVITQQEARNAFKDAEAVGKGKYGVTRKGVMRGHDVIIKMHLKPVRSKESAMLEDEMHRLAWARMKERAPTCAKLLSIPVCMDFGESAEFEEGVDNKDVDERHAYWYTVQTYISESEYNAPTSFKEWLTANEPVLRSAPREVKENIARAYGRMLACLHRTGIIHNDLHAENLLVLQCNTDAWANSCGSAPDAIVFRVIDWGLAKEYPPWLDPKTGTPVLCAYDDRREKVGLDVLARQVGYFSLYESRSGKPECRAEFAETLVDLRNILQEDPSPQNQGPTDQPSMEEDTTSPVGRVFEWLLSAFTGGSGGQSDTAMKGPTAITELDVSTWVREEYARGMRPGRDHYTKVWEDWSTYESNPEYRAQP